MRFLKAILFFIIAILVFMVSLAFITHNSTAVTVNLLFIRLPELSLAIYLIIFFVLGGLVGLMFSSLLILREKQARIQVEKRLSTTSKLITGHTS